MHDKLEKGSILSSATPVKNKGRGNYAFCQKYAKEQAAYNDASFYPRRFVSRLLSMSRNDNDDKICNNCSVNRQINLANVRNRYYNIRITNER